MDRHGRCRQRRSTPRRARPRQGELAAWVSRPRDADPTSPDRRDGIEVLAVERADRDELDVNGIQHAAADPREERIDVGGERGLAPEHGFERHPRPRNIMGRHGMSRAPRNRVDSAITDDVIPHGSRWPERCKRSRRPALASIVMTLAALLVLAFTSLGAATVNGALGYGYSSISVPIALLVTVGRVLNPALVIVEVVINLYSLFWNRRSARAMLPRDPAARDRPGPRRARRLAGCSATSRRATSSWSRSSRSCR